MNNKIYDLIVELCENELAIEKVYKLKTEGILDDFTISEMHCLDFIGRIENPNVTKLARKMDITKGGVSKMIKKLIKKDAVETYSSENNKKEIYYKLTPTGKAVFLAHEKIHNDWCLREKTFFNNFSDEELHSTVYILEKYNNHLKLRLKEINKEI